MEMIAMCIRKTEGLTVGKRYAVLGLVHFPNRLEVYIIDDDHHDAPYPVFWDAQWFKITGHMTGDLKVTYSYQSLSLTVILNACPPELDEEDFYERSVAVNQDVFQRLRALEEMILGGTSKLG
ncbi:hypothetical protein ACFP9V_19140 [Deinococcus radiopugnans]|uniref:Uncharacterized protein n=1 Tax=Deinococcus radiopugnans ATCC 19172 TaxID=585398 RepID=A0A5C4Y9W2_9DEIO|nr:hypothetical protein [Deinococcus radiopugnans]MBB6016821.1 hypothetical protein [Deinococcus radiopugnans ATCC 19172]TNM71890.1 hypothetical protein FHR04_05855 [Deinococcus radiopugnans ATCC 19172]